MRRFNEEERDAMKKATWATSVLNSLTGNDEPALIFHFGKAPGEYARVGNLCVYVYAGGVVVYTCGKDHYWDHTTPEQLSPTDHEKLVAAQRAAWLLA